MYFLGLTIVEAFKGLFFTPIFTMGDIEISIFLIFKISLSCILILISIGFIKRILKHRILKHINADPSNQEAISTVISYFIGILFFLVILQNSGFNLASLGILLGGLGVGIGFGLQTIAHDFVSGFVLLFERTLKVGDLVEIDDYRFKGLLGHIREVKLRSTIIHTLDHGDIVIPNSQLIGNRVLNWSYDSHIARLRVPVGVAYGSDPVAVTETLLKSAYMEPSVVREPPPKVMFFGFGVNALEFELWVWVHIEKHFDAQSSLHYILEYNLRQQGITIPFTQQDLWLRNPEALANHFPNLARTQADPGQTDASAHGISETHPTSHKPLGLRDVLRKVSYFEDFSDLELRQLIQVGYRKVVLPGAVLFREGDPGDDFYVVLDGSVEIYAEKLDRLLATIQENQFFGEVSLMLGIPRTATARIAEKTTLFVINRKGFTTLLQSYPSLAQQIIEAFGQYQEELRERQQQLRALGLVDASEDDQNPLAWASKRLRRLFGLNV